MKYGETNVEFLLKMMALTNQMKSRGEKTYELKKVEKVLRVLPIKFDHIVVEIEEPKDLSKMNLEESQTSIEAHEMRQNQRD